MQFEVDINGQLRQVSVQRVDGAFVVEVDGRAFAVDAQRTGRSSLSLLVSNPGNAKDSAGSGALPAIPASYDVTVTPTAPGQLDVFFGSARIPVSLNGRGRGRRQEDSGQSNGPHRLTAPMPGKVVRVLVGPGDVVRARQPVVVIEAMKMENELRAKRDGIVAELHAREGQSVDAGALLAVIADDPTSK